MFIINFYLFKISFNRVVSFKSTHIGGPALCDSKSWIIACVEGLDLFVTLNTPVHLVCTLVVK